MFFKTKVEGLLTLTELALATILSCQSTLAEQPYNVSWTRQIGTINTSDYGYSVAVDDNGSIYLSGNTNGSLYGPNSGGADIFVAKYNSLGNLLWSKQFGTASDDVNSSVSVDGAGNIYVSGMTDGSLGGSNAGGHDVFLTKFNASGNLQWSRQIGASGDETGGGVTVDQTGNAYFYGTTSGSLAGSNAGASDVFLIKYDPSGNQKWLRQLGTSGYDVNGCVALDMDGHVYISGYTDGNVAGQNNGQFDSFLAKYDIDGNIIWSRQFGTSEYDWAGSVALDKQGNAYISGTTFGSLVGPNAGRDDAFLIKYDSSGNVKWSKQIGTSTDDLGGSVVVDDGGNAYFTGSTKGSLGGPFAGVTDSFLMKYDALGNLLWSDQFGGPFRDDLLSMSLDGEGNLYLGGDTSKDILGPSTTDFDALLVKYSPVPEPSIILLITTATFCLLALNWRRQ